MVAIALPTPAPRSLRPAPSAPGRSLRLVDADGSSFRAPCRPAPSRTGRVLAAAVLALVALIAVVYLVASDPLVPADGVAVLDQTHVVRRRRDDVVHRRRRRPRR